jgi:hypothetical protein
MMDKEMKKRKYNKGFPEKAENLLLLEFPEMAENLMDQAQLTRKVSDLKELVGEMYGLLDKKDQKIWELTKNMKQMEDGVGMIMKSFQIQLDAVKEEVKRAKCGHMEKERVTVPKVTESHPTTTVKEPIKKMENPWKTVSTKKTNKTTNKSASTVKDVLPQIPQKHQNTVAITQASYFKKLKQEIKNSVNPASLLIKKEKIYSDGPIITWTVRIALNEKGQNFPRQPMLTVIEDKTGKAPLSISVISTSTAQIVFKEEDLSSFQKLLDSKMIQLVETKKGNFQQRDISRLAHLYLSGYHKDLAHAAFQNLSETIIVQILSKAATLVKQRFKPLELHNKEGHSGFSTISGRDGNSVNKIVVEHKALQNCESCSKTMLKSSYTSHLKSMGHKIKLLSTDSNHQQPHQSNTNHIQP